VEYANGEPTPEALTLAADADLLIHDAMYSDFEYQTRSGWGHSPVSAAVTVATRAGSKRLALFHHNPDAVDQEIDALAEEAKAQTSIDVFAAQEGPAIEI